MFSPHFLRGAEFFYVYDGDGNIVRSIDISGKKEYNYEHEEGRIVRATEADIELNGEIVTSKVIVNTVKYCYDEEIGLYYLQSRYYDASVGRFVNEDDVCFAVLIGDTKINNLFIYCDNNCVNGVDHSGYIPWRLIAIVSAGIAVGLVKVLSTINSKEYKGVPGGGKFLQVLIAFLLGFIQGAIVSLMAIANKTIIIGVVGGLISVCKVFKNNKKPSASKLLNAFVSGFSTVVVVSALSKLAGNILSVKTHQIADLFISFFVEEFFN